MICLYNPTPESSEGVEEDTLMVRVVSGPAFAYVLVCETFLGRRGDVVEEVDVALVLPSQAGLVTVDLVSSTCDCDCEDLVVGAVVEVFEAFVLLVVEPFGAPAAFRLAERGGCVSPFVPLAFWFALTRRDPNLALALLSRDV